MKLVSRKRVVAAAFVVAFVVVFAALGAVSKSTSTAGGVTTAAPVPYAPWYWTMIVSPSDPKVLVLGTSSGLYRSSDGADPRPQAAPQAANLARLAVSGSTMFAGGVPGPNPV